MEPLILGRIIMKNISFFVLLLVLTFTSVALAEDDFSSKIEITFEQAMEVNWPLDKACKHVFYVKNVSSEFIFLQVDVSYGEGQITLFPQPAFLPLYPGEQKRLVVLVEYPVRNKNVGSYEMEVTYTFKNRFGQENFSKTYFYTFNKLDNEPFDHLTGPEVFLGKITDNLGTPLEGAKIILTCETCDGFFREAVTDNRGRYALSVPAKEDWYLIVSKQGYKTKYFFNVSPGELDVVMEPFEHVLPEYEINKRIELDIGFWKQVPTLDGKKVLLCQGMENWPDTSMKQRAQIMLYSLNGTKIWSHEMGDEAWGCDLTGNGSYAVYVTNPQTYPPSSQHPVAHLVLLDGKMGSVIWEKELNTTNFPYPDDPYSHESPELFYSREVQFSHDGKWIALGEGDNSVIWLLNREDSSVIWSKFLGVGQVRRIIFSNNDRYIYAGTGEGYLFKLDTQNGTVVWKSYIESWPYTYGLAMSPDEKYIAAGCKSGMLSVIKTDNGELLWNKYMGIMNVRWVQFTPDGKLLIAGSGSPLGTSVFDVHSGKLKWKAGFSAVGMVTADGKHVFHADGVALFYSIDGTLESSYDPNINTCYWKVAYINPEMTHFVVGARDLPDKRTALVFYRAKNIDKYINASPSHALTPYTITTPLDSPADTLHINSLQKDYVVIMPKLIVPEDNLGKTAHLYWSFCIQGYGCSSPFDLGEYTLTQEKTTFYIFTNPINLNSFTGKVSIFLGMSYEDSELVYNYYDVSFE